MCECAFCTFPDKLTAAAEFARVLRPGGRLGLTDVVADPDRLPAALTSLVAWVACIAAAARCRSTSRSSRAPGLRVLHVERQDAAMVRMIAQIRVRIDLVKMTSRAKAEALGLDFDAAGPLREAAQSATADGTLGYAMLIAEKPA